MAAGCTTGAIVRLLASAAEIESGWHTAQMCTRACNISEPGLRSSLSNELSRPQSRDIWSRLIDADQRCRLADQRRQATKEESQRGSMNLPRNETDPGSSSRQQHPVTIVNTQEPPG